MNESMTIPTIRAISPGDDAPAVETPPATPPFSQSWVGRAGLYLARSRPGRPGWYEAGFLGLMLAALALRLWELGGRVMHYDEAIHLYYSWQLSNFQEYIHSPWMHGPFQIELTALLLQLLGDSDFTARLGYVLFGTALVGLPWFLRQPLGRTGAMLTGLLLAVSPSLLYFSRFGRNDIIMAFLAAALFILMWRYFRENKARYLYLAAAALALMFATKETAYIITLTFGMLAFLTALVAGASRLGSVDNRSPFPGAVGFLILLITLTMPQWSAGVALFQDWLGLTLVNRDGVTDGIVGAPHWEAPFLPLPLFAAPWWLHGLALLLLLGGGLLYAGKASGQWLSRLAVGAVPVALAGAAALALLRPLDGVVDLVIAGAAALAAGVFMCWRYSWSRGVLLTLGPFLIASAYFALLFPVVKVDTLLHEVLPSGIQVAVADNAVPVNFAVAGGALALAGLVSLALGLRWKGGVWLLCALIFYCIWTTLYTTYFNNYAGVFSGAWQGLGYWISQQDVARGNQPWYYYFVGLSVYEFLPVIFGLIGAVVFVKRRDGFGLALTCWAGVNLLAYTVASEKMPWLLVNITLPFIFLAGKLLGELVEGVPWRRIGAGGWLLLLLPLTAPLLLAGALYAAIAYVNPEPTFPLPWGIALVGAALLAVATAWLARRAGADAGMALAGLGVAILLLGLTTWAAFRAAYTYDDSNREILVYAQGSADLLETYREFDADLWAAGDQSGLASPAQVDYDLWYPLQWYVRHQQEAGLLRFTCFRDEDGAGGCRALEGDIEASGLLLAAHHRAAGAGSLPDYRQTGPRRNLLWFPETYRRPGEHRQSEEFPEEFTKDLIFFKDAASDRESWDAALNYLLFRQLDSDWFTSEYYTYRPRAEAGAPITPGLSP